MHDSNLTPKTQLKLACERLRAQGLRITKPRIAIINALAVQKHPVSIDAIHSGLKKGLCDLVTVYRCLDTFIQASLVRRVFGHNGTRLYELGLNEEPFYVSSKTTTKFARIDEVETAEIRRVIECIEVHLESRGYQNVTHVVQFFGEPPEPDPIACPDFCAVKRLA